MYLNDNKKENAIFSIISNMLIQHKSAYVFMNLIESNPYIRFSEPNVNDTKFFHKLNENDEDVQQLINSCSFVDKANIIYNLKEQMIWVSPAENGKFSLVLRHIQLLYKNKFNKVIKSKYAVSHCIEYGCISLLDTKNYFIYGPRAQMFDILQLKAINCDDNYLAELPDIEFAFYNYNNKIDKTSDNIIFLTLTPKDYMFTNYEYEDNSRQCVSIFGETGSNFGWTFGLAFLNKFAFSYDFGNQKIGFVRNSSN